MTARHGAMGVTLSDELRAVLDALPVPLMLVDDADHILHANPAMRARLGAVGPDEPIRLDAPQLADAYVARTQLGRCITVLPHSTEPRTSNPETQRLASLGFMVAGVCHEVSNPLSAIHSMVQILQSRRGVTPDTLEKGLGSIAANIARVLAITKKLGDFSRVTGDAATSVSIDAAVREATTLLRHSRWGGAVQVDYAALPGALTLARPGELQQVILNLLLNAAQAMGGVGRIDVQTQATPEGRIRLTIRDTGPGIPPDHLDRVFEPFFTTKQAGEGTGLGLAISYEIVHELGGAMYASNHPEGGACMQIDLPPAPQP
jgi:C4-dicarboxylate-specific signal transduction histidine kinase